MYLKIHIRFSFVTFNEISTIRLRLYIKDDIHNVQKTDKFVLKIIATIL